MLFRSVVAYGMLNALTSKYKTMVFRPAVSNHDEFTPILLAASNAGLGVALSTGLDVHKVREDKDTARGDIVGAFNDAMDVSRADAALIVGTDKSHVNDPTSYEFDANVAADLKAGVFLAVCTIDRWPVSYTHLDVYKRQGSNSCGAATPSSPLSSHPRTRRCIANSASTCAANRSTNG